MTTVKILPEILSNQIAAGEVVQRPSSVVKELVENSIDAGSKTIIIEIAKGGKSLIRVCDDGCGLLRDDALLAMERYATSKIFTKLDLFSISTMGFRGEALPSIASISKLCIVTRTDSSDIATKIEIVGGKIRDVSDAGAPVGTMVEVKDLFFNTPARKKFLKTDNTENSHIIDTISGMALGNPDVGFRLFINSKLYKNFSSSDTLFSRSINVLGKDTADKLYKLDFISSKIKIHGFCSNPIVTRSSAAKIFLFVNSRLVYDRGFIAAVFKGYQQRIMKGRYPLGAFFIDIAHDQVDVNVHPSKREIKFYNPESVYQQVSKTIADTLYLAQQNIKTYSKAKIIPKARFEFIDNTFQPDSRQIKNQGLQFSPADKESIKSDQVELDKVKLNNPIPEYTDKVEQPVMEWPKKESYSNISNASDLPPEAALPPDYPSLFTAKTSPLKIIGQTMGTYIIAEDHNALLLIDQHAAHERIVYEKLKKRYKTLNVQSQNLIVPEILELNFREADLLIEILDDLKALGMIIEPFGDTSFVIKSVPAIIDEKEIKPIVLDMLETGLDKKNQFSKEAWLDNCLILMACHDSIRANAALNGEEIKALLFDLEKCENSCHCPHGRPIVVTLTKKQMEKLFKRVL